MEIRPELVTKNLERILSERNMSQSDLARLAKMRPEYLNKVIRGKKPLGIHVAIKLADALGCSIEEITTGKAPEKKPTRTVSSLLQALSDLQKENAELEEELLRVKNHPLYPFLQNSTTRQVSAALDILKRDALADARKILDDKNKKKDTESKKRSDR